MFSVENFSTGKLQLYTTRAIKIVPIALGCWSETPLFLRFYVRRARQMRLDAVNVGQVPVQFHEKSISFLAKSVPFSAKVV
jgi:hypothetical protein